MGGVLDRRLVVLLFPILALSGCAARIHKYDRWYDRLVPHYYDATANPLMFSYEVDDASWSVDQWFGTMELIGRLKFNAGPQRWRDLYAYGQSVGAHIIVVGRTETSVETVEDVRTVYNPTSTTIYDDAGNAIGSMASTTRQQIPYTYTEHHYDYSVWFFREDPAQTDWWELTRDGVKFEAPRKRGLDGRWTDGDYVIELGTVGRQYLGFLESMSEEQADKIERAARKDTGAARQWWRQGDLKLVIERDSMSAIWFKANRAPNPCKFKLDTKTGYLKGDCADGQTVALERVAVP